MNHVPPPPCGPYFRSLEILTSLDSGMPEFRTSSLEKSYVWQPHFGPELGVKLELVSQEALMIPEKPLALDPMDLKYLNAAYEKKVDLRGKNYDPDNKPWWLRNTTYIENNPFNVSSRARDDDLVLKGVEQKSKIIDHTKSNFSSDDIAQSFTDVQTTVDRLVAQNKQATLLWSAPFLPEVSNLSDQGRQVSGRKRSLVRFDEDPRHTTKAVRHETDDGVDRVQRFDTDHSIITNGRPCLRPDGSVNDKLVDVSLVAPETASKESLHSLVKDYRLEFQDRDGKDCFVLVVQESDGHAYFFPVQDRMDVRKLGTGGSKELAYVVQRNDA